MSAFLSGVLFGFLLAGSIAVIVITSRRRPAPRREPIEWVPEFHDPQPPVTTKIVTQKREFII